MTSPSRDQPAGMPSLSLAGLADRSGVSPEFVRRLVRLQILLPTGEDFRLSDIYRTRLARGFEQAGLSLDALGAAIAAGKFSLAFMDLSNWRWAALSSKTYRQVCAETGVSFEFLSAAQEAMGYERPGQDDPVREDDLEVIPAFQMAFAAGIPEGEVVRLLRTYGQAFRQITDAEASVYHSFVEMPLLRGGMDHRQAMDLAQQFGEQVTPFQERAILSLYRRYQERAWIEDIIEHAESALEEMGLDRRPPRPPAICFLDLSGYTRLTEERGDEAAAELAAQLADMVQRTSRGHGGRPVKWLGDGVMFHFKDPGPAVVSALEMVSRAPQAGLLPAHAGLAAGPVVTQGGDYFGRTVNVASRIAARAAAGQTLVSDEVVQACQGVPVTFRRIGEVQLKGMPRPVRLHEAVLEER